MTGLLKKISVCLAISAFVSPVAVRHYAAGEFPNVVIRKQNDYQDFYKSSDTVCAGDYIKSADGIAYGCVTGELNDYGIDTAMYSVGVKSQSEIVMFAENETNVYLYVYSPDPTIGYDRADISTSLVPDDETAQPDDFVESWRTYSLSLVSVSSSGFLRKYLIDGLKPLSTLPRRYVVREIYEYEHRTDEAYFIKKPTEYMIQKDIVTGQINTQVKSLFSIDIDGVGAFQLINSKYDHWLDSSGSIKMYAHQFLQSSYMLFNTDYPISDLRRVELTYDWKEYTCGTDIKIKTLGNAEDFRTGFKGMSSCKRNIDILQAGTEQKIIEPKEYTVEVYQQFVKKVKVTWNTITDLSNAEERSKFNGDVDLDKYRWGVFFQNVSFSTNVGDKTSLAKVPLNDIHFTDAYQNMDVVSYNGAREVDGVSILTLWFMENGAIRKAIATDVYKNADINKPISNPTVTFDLFQSIKNFFGWFGQNIGTVVLIITAIFLLIAFPIIVSLLKAGMTLVQSIIVVAKAPFKFVKWLFTPMKWGKHNAEQEMNH